LQEVIVVVGITGASERFDGGLVVVGGLDLHVGLRAGASGEQTVGGKDDVVGLLIDGRAGIQHEWRFDCVGATGIRNLHLHGSATGDSDVDAPSGPRRWGMVNKQDCEQPNGCVDGRF